MPNMTDESISEFITSRFNHNNRWGFHPTDQPTLSDLERTKKMLQEPTSIFNRVKRNFLTLLSFLEPATRNKLSSSVKTEIEIE